METPLGRSLARAPRLRIAAALVAMAVLAMDLLCTVYWGSVWFFLFEILNPLALPAALVCACMASQPGQDGASWGLTFAPRQGFVYWTWATLGAAVAIGAMIGVAVLVAYVWFGWTTAAIPRVVMQDVPRLAVLMCLLAPLREEIVYRLLLCPPLVAIVGPRWTIVISGTVFALMHYLSGNPGPDNLVAGFFLAWAFLKSGSLTIPLLWHMLANAVALGVWTGHSEIRF